jgi:putative ABC transport system permease protein
MTLLELFRFALRGLTGHGLRTALSLLGVSIGIAAVLVLTALGEGAKQYVVGQFQSLGTNLLIVLPGKTETSGSFGIGGVPNDLTLDDAEAIERFVPQARRVVPIAMGTEEVAAGALSRQIAVIGSTPEYLKARQLRMASGEFLPEDEFSRGAAVAVLGPKAARELFRGEDPIGKVVRIGGWRMRVIGVLAKQGVKLGINFDDIAIVPVATAMRMFNRSSLFRILIQAHAHTDLDLARQNVLELITERHEEEDVTVVTQDAVADTFAGILGMLTLFVSGIAAISLSVAGFGIMNVMLVSVSERTREIGLLKAVGVARRQILAAFVTEAAIISSLGGLLGLAIGFGLVHLGVRLYPVFQASPPAWAVAAAMTVSLGVGVVFGILPAWRATKLDPVLALGRR